VQCNMASAQRLREATDNVCAGIWGGALTEDYSMLIFGSCHCRNISFALVWEPDPSEIPARACDCLVLYQAWRSLDVLSDWPSQRHCPRPYARLEVRLRDADR